MRELSPLNDTSKFDVLSGQEGLEVQEPSLIYSQMVDYARENSPSLSPSRGRDHMSTQFGNFLYQVEAKQFPGSKITKPDKHHQVNLIKAYQIKSNHANKHLNPKQIYKQLQKFYHQKSEPANDHGDGSPRQLNNHEIMLKNLVN